MPIVMHKYSIVHIKDRICIIPSCWICDKRNRTLWPSHLTSNVLLDIAIIEEKLPDVNEEWTSYKIKRWIRCCDTWEEALVMLEQARRNSTKQNEPFIVQDKLHKRKRFHACSDRHQRRIIEQETEKHLCQIANVNRHSCPVVEAEMWLDEDEDMEIGRNFLSSDTESLNYSRAIFNDEVEEGVVINDIHNDTHEYSEYSVDNIDNAVYCATIENDVTESQTDLSSDITQWAGSFGICLNATNALLRILNRHIPNCSLPLDARTLLCTPRAVTIMTMGDGQYLHFGVEAALRLIMRNNGNSNVSHIKLSLNIDGLPISRSSRYAFWPILIADKSSNSVQMVGVYNGMKKPSSANDYLRIFVDELKSVIEKKFMYEDKKISVSLSSIICDAPAKSFILYTKGHTGFSSCSKCTIIGQSVNRTTCFPYEEVPSRLRTDEDFVLQSDEEYHRGRSILTEIPHIGLVSNVPLDYMHLICIGCVKKLLLLWLYGPLRVRIGSNNSNTISENLISMRNMVPSEFARKPRGLLEICNWKATEFRQFLLYTGPIALKSIVNKNIYVHFLTLHVAVSILVSPHLVEHAINIKYAENLLKYFVQNFEILYGKQFLNHNVHNLLHLCDDVRKFGTLDNFSAFPFENFLSTLKRKIRKPEKPLEQLARRYGEQTISNLSKYPLILDNLMLRKQHSTGPLLHTAQNSKFYQYKIFKKNSFLVNCNDERNNCVQLNDESIIIALNIVKIENDDIYVIGHNCKIISEVYNQPISSTLLNIYEISIKKDCLFQWPVSEIKKKMCKLKRLKKATYFVIPLRH